MGLLALAWCALVAVVGPVGDFPLNDDWVYAAAVRTFLTTGRFEVSGFSSANVGPQVLWGVLFCKLFGFSFTALRYSTLVLGLTGGIGIYLLFDEIWKDRAGALLLAACILFNPVYFALAHSFMTDVPFIALIVASMLAVVAGFVRRSDPLLAVGVGLALVAVLLRQFAVVVLAGFAVAFVAERGLRPKQIVLAVLPLVAGLLLNHLFTQWLADTGRKPVLDSVSGVLPSLFAGFGWKLRVSLFVIVSYVGLFLVPMALAFVPAWRAAGGHADAGANVRIQSRSAAWRWAGLVATIVLLSLAYRHRGGIVPVGENVLAWFGIGPLTNGDTFIGGHLPQRTHGADVGWGVVTALTIASSAIVLVATAIGAAWLARAVVRAHARPGSASVAVGCFAAGVTIAYLAILMVVTTRFALFDRYMLLLAILGGLAVPLIQRHALAASPGRRTRHAAGFALVAASAAFSVVTTHDYLAWSAVRWNALQALVTAGVAPSRIDGGYEFNGWYLYDPAYRKTAGKSWWWVHDDEYRAASGPASGYRVLHRLPVDRWWQNGAPDVFILQR